MIPWEGMGWDFGAGWQHHLEAGGGLRGGGGQSMVQALVLRGASGPFGGWGVSEAVAPVFFSAHPEDNTALSLGPQTKGPGPGSQQSEREKTPPWQLLPSGHLPVSPGTEGTGLQEAATCPPPLPKAGHLSSLPSPPSEAGESQGL